MTSKAIISQLAPALCALITLSSWQVSYATDYWVLENRSDTLYRVDVLARTATLVGHAGVDVQFGGLAFNPSGTVLYAWSTVPGAGGNLYQVNQTTGAFTLIGGSSLNGADTFDIDPVTGAAIAWNVHGQLHDVNLSNGNTSLRASISPTSFVSNSSFDDAGTLFSVSTLEPRSLEAVNIASGGITPVGSTGLGSVSVTNLGYNPSDGFLYAIAILDSSYPLYRIDPTTGAAVFLGGVAGLPNDSRQQITMGDFSPVPEPRARMLFMMLSALASLGSRRSAGRQGGC
jgi:hypothetical protein